MSNYMEFIENLREAYDKQELEFDVALKVWKSSNLSPKKMKDQVKDDIGIKLSDTNARLVYKYATDFCSREEYVYENIYNKKIDTRLIYSKILPLTPAVKSRLIKTGSSTYRAKNASITIEWIIDERTNDKGEKVSYLIRKNKPEELGGRDIK